MQEQQQNQGMSKRVCGSPRIRVLLVDDSAVVRQALSRRLEQERDIEVVGQAGDGQQALDQIRLLNPDVILMDVNMPRMNGIAATKLIAAQMPHVPIIGLSMHSRADVGDDMRAAGAVAYLEMDGPADDVIAAIRGRARL
jgi:DNA-binding NarL/FixJ family response regulator